MNDLRIRHGHYRVRGKGIPQSGEPHVEVQPVQARTRTDQAIWPHERSIFSSPDDPPETAVSATGQKAAGIDHLGGRIERVDAISKGEQWAGQGARARAHIQDGPRGDQQTAQRQQQLVRIRRPMPIKACDLVVGEDGSQGHL